MSTPNDKIRFGSALPGPGVAHDAPNYNYDELLGRSAVLLPAGENITLDARLPCRGRLVRQLALKDWGGDWLQLHFDEAIEYDGAQVKYCLVRARWFNVPIGSEFCPVFVLTDREGSLTAKRSWSSTDFQFVSWGLVKLDPIAQA